MIQKITSFDEIKGLKENKIIGEFELNNSKILFNGIDNILITPPHTKEKTKLKNTTINFYCNNSVVFLSNSILEYSIDLFITNNNFFYIGNNNKFNTKLTLQCSEQCNIFIGNDNLFSFNIFFRTSDVHLIYDINTHKRLNNSKSIFIGDHVWIGQDCRIFKGTTIGSGAIIGACSFTTGKKIPSNTLWSGVPARQLRNNVFFHKRGTHYFNSKETEEWDSYSGNEYIYEYLSNETIDFQVLENDILLHKSAKEKADYLLNFNKEECKKNRFYRASCKSRLLLHWLLHFLA